jgi:hypothetical protein
VCCAPLYDEESCGPAPGEKDLINPEFLYQLRHIHYGSFTKAGLVEATATLYGCEAHAGNYGGTVLLRKVGSAWQRVRYDGGVNPDACEPYRRKDGRDILVCAWEDGHQGHEHTYLFSYDFAEADEKDRWSEIAVMDDSSFAACWTDEGETVVVAKLKARALVDLNRDGMRDLKVEAEFVRAPITKAYHAKCKAREVEEEARWKAKEEGRARAEGPLPDPKSELPKPKAVKLEFYFNGKVFKPTPATAKLMQSLVEGS